MLGRKKESDAKKFALGAAVAAGVGYLVGLLTAPQSGKKTRDDLKKTAQKGISEAEAEVQKLHKELDGLMEDFQGKKKDLGSKTSKELSELIEKAKGAKTKANEMLKAMKNGEAEDEELQKAVSDANKAIDHVRKYLKK